MSGLPSPHKLAAKLRASHVDATAVAHVRHGMVVAVVHPRNQRAYYFRTHEDYMDLMRELRERA